MLQGSIGISLLRNMLTGKGIVGVGNENKKGKWIVRAAA